MTSSSLKLPDDWTDVDAKAIDTVRVLAADAVQNVGNGHPGTAMSLAPAAYLLFQKYLRINPADPKWPGRDRFVLSAGHSSLTLYIQLFLAGFGLELDDLKALRTWDSKTPGHPEYGHTPGVETTTGPLGQGVGNAVGMAMAARREHGLFDPETSMGESFFDHHIYCIASDGDLEEGVSNEASSLAGTQRLGNLTLIWDDNAISIEDDTNIAFTENVQGRYEALGWHVQTVDWTNGGKGYTEDVPALAAALDEARKVTDRPSFIALKTIIGWPAPNLRGTGKAHGAALGEDEVAATKRELGFDPDKTFEVDPKVLEHTRAQVAEKGAAEQARWDADFATWREANPERAALWDRMAKRELPDGWDADLPTWDADEKGIATRKASAAVLQTFKDLPEIWGGSADLAESNNTPIDGEPSFLPTDRQTKMWEGNEFGRNLHFGVREHGMGAILNGITLHGGSRPYGATFLIFSDYMRPPVRLAALMKLPTIYVWTHDSIGLGEDGPTHQPIEQLANLRAVPGLDVVRPADANETAIAWRTALSHNDRPAGLALTRQNLPVFPRGVDGYAEASEVAKGAYTLLDTPDGSAPDVILVGTGSEVQYCVGARDQLAAQGVQARVVSMPCKEWFDEQDDAYRDSVFPADVLARVSIEAGVAQGWREIVGDFGEIISLDHYGASAAGSRLFTEFGFTADAVTDRAKKSIKNAADGVRRLARAAHGPVGPADAEAESGSDTPVG
ncbi:transketolase [Naumannella cuiyingiana]|uniref:Transketolase n=1 Tax=Naumannella cuiyingiana TaxID=1347891 RepID=A0A7Z0IM17_9ACTN|nr:transketolase [Naumannella cuiyingiana]NYI72168.1 transketolase [Naumannella cuiyingiana]